LFPGAFRSLHFAVRFRVVAKYLGQMLLLVAALGLVPAGVALASGNQAVALCYALTLGLLAACGGLVGALRCEERVQANEALVITALVFLVTGVAMAFPLAGYGIEPLDALFESISGITTTGLSTLGSVEGRPRSFLFARAWLQWVGGLGVAVLALAFVIRAGAASQRLGFDEREVADFVGGTRHHARRVLIIYLALTAVALGAALVVGVPAFDALVHVLAAVSTGGFSSHDASLAALSPAGRWVVTASCLSGAVALSWYYRVYFQGLRPVFRDTRIWGLVWLTAICALLLAAFLGRSGERSLGAVFSDAVWMAVSAQTTAGFSVLPVQDLDAASKLVLIISMLIGGEMGSTAGGFKIFRFLLLLRLLWALVLRASMPAGSQLPLRVGRVGLGRDDVEAAAALALGYVGVILVSWLAFLAYGYEALDSLFDVVSAFGTVGLSAGTVRAGLEPALKIVLCLDMLMGRVELLAFLMLVFPGTWLGRRRSSR
jgi:trk system potassium uptake protein TrkH